MRKSNWDYVDKFKFRLPCRRKTADGKWDSCWPSYIVRAAEQLDIEYVFVNEGMFFQRREHCELVLQRAKELERRDAETAREHALVWQRLLGLLNQ
jgi:hypothetical protein